MPEQALGLRDLDCDIPLDHAIQFVREYKCFDTEVIQVSDLRRRFTVLCLVNFPMHIFKAGHLYLLASYKLFIPEAEVVRFQARPGMYVEHVIIASVHNTKHLKDTSRAFYKMVCLHFKCLSFSFVKTCLTIAQLSLNAFFKRFLVCTLGRACNMLPSKDLYRATYQLFHSTN